MPSRQSALHDKDAAAGRAQPQSIHERLRQAILTLKLRPGERVSERTLEELLGSSRTPIREALFRLEGEGLVIRRGRSHRVAPLELTEILEAFEYREHAEAAVAHLACRRADSGGIARIQGVLDAALVDDTIANWFAIGTNFHIMLAELSGNRFLVRAITDVFTRIERARWMMASLSSARAEAYDEHSHILELIRRQHAEEAAEALAVHARGLREKLSQALTESRPDL